MAPKLKGQAYVCRVCLVLLSDFDVLALKLLASYSIPHSIMHARCEGASAAVYVLRMLA